MRRLIYYKKFSYDIVEVKTTILMIFSTNGKLEESERISFELNMFTTDINGYKIKIYDVDHRGFLKPFLVLSKENLNEDYLHNKCITNKVDIPK